MTLWEGECVVGVGGGFWIRIEDYFSLRQYLGKQMFGIGLG